MPTCPANYSRPVRVAHKHPDDCLDYIFDWTGWLAAGETIVTSSTAVEAGITLILESHTATAHTIWLTGGTANTTYTVTNRIITTAGRSAARSLNIPVCNHG